MDKRIFMQYAAASVLAMASTSVFSEKKKPVIRHSLSGIDSEAKPFDLDDLAGKVCLISFFSAGCNVCTRDLKLMREFYLSNMTRNFALIGVNVDEKKEDFIEYMRLISLSIPADQRFPILWRKDAAHKDTFGKIISKPTHFVLDKAHRQVLRREGTFRPDDWDDLWTSIA